VLRSEISSGVCTKLRNVAASNDRDHALNFYLGKLVVAFSRSQVNIGRASALQSLLLLLARPTYIMVLFFTYIPFVVNHTINATPPEWLQQKVPATSLQLLSCLGPTHATDHPCMGAKIVDERLRIFPPP